MLQSSPQATRLSIPALAGCTAVVRNGDGSRMDRPPRARGRLLLMQLGAGCLRSIPARAGRFSASADRLHLTGLPPRVRGVFPTAGPCTRARGTSSSAAGCRWAPSVEFGLRHDGGGRRDRGRHGRRAAPRTLATRANAILDRLAVLMHQRGVTLFESPALVARWVYPARSLHTVGTAAVDARRRADVVQDGADPLVERRVAAVVDLQPAEPLLDLSRSPAQRDTGALEGQQDCQAPAQEMVPAGSTDRADDPHVGVALPSLDRPAGVCRRRVPPACAALLSGRRGPVRRRGPRGGRGPRVRFRAPGATRDGGGAGRRARGSLRTGCRGRRGRR